jgi:hypothetical protein
MQGTEILSSIRVWLDTTQSTMVQNWNSTPLPYGSSPIVFLFCLGRFVSMTVSHENCEEQGSNPRTWVSVLESTTKWSICLTKSVDISVYKPFFCAVLPSKSFRHAKKTTYNKSKWGDNSIYYQETLAKINFDKSTSNLLIIVHIMVLS